jgi:hypothetical protein
VFQKLVSHNEDLRRIRDKGYSLTFDSDYLVIRDIPYLNAGRELCWGAIVATLIFIDENRVKQNNHEIYFAGSAPYDLEGELISNLAGGPASIQLSDKCDDVVVQRSFSNKPIKQGAKVDFTDHFEKIESYVGIISGPAIELHGANPYQFRADEEVKKDTIFKFHDTLTSRAEIGDLTKGFEEDVVAIIGLGGTGSYLLDFLVKTRVKEIRGFDKDLFHIHNAYRSPGAVSKDEFDRSKAKVYGDRYNNFRYGLTIEHRFIDKTSGDDLKGVTFAFVCVDKGSSRADIFELLIALKIPFIDVGLGLNRKRGSLNGLIRTTYYPSNEAAQLKEKGLAELTDRPDDMYRRNIQISELNALNACVAIMRFKQLRGFYFQEELLQHLLFEIGDMKMVTESSHENPT